MASLDELLADKLLEARLAQEPNGQSYTPQGQEGTTPYDEDMLARIRGLLAPASAQPYAAPGPNLPQSFGLKDLLGDMADSLPGKETADRVVEGQNRAAASLISGAPLLRDAIDYAGAVPDWLGGLIARGSANPSLRKYALGEEKQREELVKAHQRDTPILAGTGKFLGAAAENVGETLTGTKLLQSLGIAAKVPGIRSLLASSGVGAGLSLLADKYFGEGEPEKAPANTLMGFDIGEYPDAIRALKDIIPEGPEVLDRNTIREMFGLGEPKRGRAPVVVVRGNKLERIENEPPVGGYSKASKGTADVANRRYRNTLSQSHSVDPRIQVAMMQLAGEQAKAKGASALEFAKLERQNFDRLAQMSTAGDRNLTATLTAAFPGTKDFNLGHIKQLAHQQTLEQMGEGGGGAGGGPTIPDIPDKVKQGDKDYGESNNFLGKATLVGGSSLLAYLLARKLGMGPVATNLLKKTGLLKGGEKVAEEITAARPWSAQGPTKYAKEMADMLRTRGRGGPPAVIRGGGNPVEDALERARFVVRKRIGGPPGEREPTAAARAWAERLRGVEPKPVGPQGRLPYKPSASKEFIIPKETTTHIRPTPEEYAAHLKEIADSYLPTKGSEEYYRLNRIRQVMKERANIKYPPAVVHPESGLTYQELAEGQALAGEEALGVQKGLRGRIRTLQRALGLDESELPKGMDHDTIQDEILSLRELLKKRKR